MRSGHELQIKMVAVQARGVVFLLILALVVYFGAILFISTGLVLFLPFSLGLYRGFMNYCAATFFRLIPALFEVVFGVKVRVSGDLRQCKDPCVVIMNHRTRFDWMFLWCYMIRFGDLHKHRISLKSALKKIPGLGWGMQASHFLFLSRKWADDEKYLTEHIAYYNAIGYPLQLLVFPEGTDLSDSNKAKSHQFAEKNGLPKYEYVLNPRTKGFVHCVQEFRKGNPELSVLNLSVAYVGGMPQNERDILAGNWPTEIHFHAEHVPPSDLPGEDKGLEDWLRRCWYKKEKQLERFYANNQFDGPYSRKEERFGRVRLDMYGSLVFWGAYFMALCYGLYYYFSFVCLYLVFWTMFLVAVSSLTSGMENQFPKLYRWQNRH